jgi:hypothetical protein
MIPARTSVPQAPSKTCATISLVKSSTERSALHGSWYAST